MQKFEHFNFRNGNFSLVHLFSQSSDSDLGEKVPVPPPTVETTRILALLHFGQNTAFPFPQFGEILAEIVGNRPQPPADRRKIMSSVQKLMETIFVALILQCRFRRFFDDLKSSTPLVARSRASVLINFIHS